MTTKSVIHLTATGQPLDLFMLSLRELSQMNTRPTGRVSLRLICHTSEIIKSFHTLQYILPTFNQIPFRPCRFKSFTL